MTKELEALWRAMLCLIDGNRDIETENALETIEEALKRNEPMKPIYEKDGTRSCPCCKGNWLTPNFKFCSDCGQKLDWSDDEIELKWKDLQRGNK